jgi:DNA invertase Pin-like site-specific DNA recombinase
MQPRQPLTQAKPAVAYCRRSTDRQEQSITDQRKAIEQYAHEQGFDVLDYYVDDAISGSTAEAREAFQKLMDDARARNCPFRYVLVYDIKRFGRLDTDEAGYYRYLLRRQGVEIIYISEGFTGSDADELILPVKQWQARQELKDLAKVTLRGMKSRVQKGRWNGGTPPYGYDLSYFASDDSFINIMRFMPDGTKQLLDAEGNIVRVLDRGHRMSFSKSDYCKLVPSEPARVEAIQWIFKWYVYEGCGFKTIADRLNVLGIPSPRNGNWSNMHKKGWAMTTIRELLVNPVYTGDTVWNRLSFAKFYQIRNGQTEARHGLPGNGPEHNAEDDWIVVPDTHEPLVPRELFEQARSIREKRRDKLGIETYRNGHGANSTFLLSGLIVCAHCGHTWQGYSTRRGKPKKDGEIIKTYYYTCGGYATKGNTVCIRSIIPQAEIEDWVLDQIGKLAERYLQPDGPEQLLASVHKGVRTESRAIEETLARIAKRREEITRMISNALLNIAEENRDLINDHLRGLRAEMEALKQQDEELRQQVAEEEQAGEIVAEAMERFQQVRVIMTHGTIDEQRSIVRAFVRKITFDPDTRKGTVDFWILPQEQTTEQSNTTRRRSTHETVVG